MVSSGWNRLQLPEMARPTNFHRRPPICGHLRPYLRFLRYLYANALRKSAVEVPDDLARL